MLVDTHAHLHFDDYAAQIDQVLEAAQKAGVNKILTVGVDEQDSAKAVGFAQEYENVWATVGLHPHDAKNGQPAMEVIAELAQSAKVVAIGECGLDYYRNLSDKDDQLTAFRFQIELALKLNKPLVFHVREAFDDFFKILDSYQGVRGVVHSFTSDRANMEKAVERGLYIALNGIMTFTKDDLQLEAAKAVPLEKLLLETDCPFLAPMPLRGKVNEPANLKLTAQFLASLRGEEIEELSAATTANAEKLFSI